MTFAEGETGILSYLNCREEIDPPAGKSELSDEMMLRNFLNII